MCVFLFRNLRKHYSNIFTNPLRSLLSGRNRHHGRHSEQPSRCIETSIIFWTEKKRTTFVNGVPSFVPVSASTTESSSTCCKSKGSGRIQMTVRPLPLRRGMPPARTYSAYCSFRRATQPSLSYEDPRARHSRTEQVMDGRGQRCAIRLKGVRANRFTRSMPK